MCSKMYAGLCSLDTLAVVSNLLAAHKIHGANSTADAADLLTVSMFLLPPSPWALQACAHYHNASMRALSDTQMQSYRAN